MRYKISGPIINIKYFFLILAVVFLVFGGINLSVFFLEGFRNNFDDAYSIFRGEVFFCALLFYIIYRGLKSKQTFEFDAQFLYIIANKTESKIDLKCITKIEKPIIQWGNNLNNWIVEYREVNGKMEKLYLNTSFRNHRFGQFLNRVKNLNSKVIINNY